MTKFEQPDDSPGLRAVTNYYKNHLGGTVAKCEQPEFRKLRLARDHEQACEKSTSTKARSSSKLVQKEKAEAALDWLTNASDRRLLTICFGLRDQAALSEIDRLPQNLISAKIQELIDGDSYMQERKYLLQREQVWQAYPHLSLIEREFVQELFGFYNPQGEINHFYFAGAKISWESLKQKIKQINAEQARLQEPSRCSLKEHDYLFRDMADPTLSQPIKDTISHLWPHLGGLERRITLLNFGLAGCQIHSPEEITQMLFQGQPFGLNKVRGLLRQISAKSLSHTLKKTGF